MNGTKKWYESSGMWGSILGVAAVPIGIITGVSLGSEDIGTAASALATIGGAVSATVGAVGSLLALYGRLTATKQIG